MTEIPPFPSVYPTTTLVSEYLDETGGFVFAFEMNGAWVGYRITYDDARAVRDGLIEKLGDVNGDDDAA
jgi:hypothetical protein